MKCWGERERCADRQQYPGAQHLSQEEPEQVSAPGTGWLTNPGLPGRIVVMNRTKATDEGCDEDEVDGDEQADEGPCATRRPVHGPAAHRVAGDHLHRRVPEGQALAQCGAVVCELQEQPVAVDEVPHSIRACGRGTGTAGQQERGEGELPVPKPVPGVVSESGSGPAVVATLRIGYRCIDTRYGVTCTFVLSNIFPGFGEAVVGPPTTAPSMRSAPPGTSSRTYGCCCPVPSTRKAPCENRRAPGPAQWIVSRIVLVICSSSSAELADT